MSLKRLCIHIYTVFSFCFVFFCWEDIFVFVKLAPDIFLPTNSMYSLYNLSIMYPHCHLTNKTPQSHKRKKKLNASSRNTHKTSPIVVIVYALLGRILSLSYEFRFIPLLLPTILFRLFIRRLYSFTRCTFHAIFVLLYISLYFSCLLFVTLFYCCIFALFVCVCALQGDFEC